MAAISVHNPGDVTVSWGLLEGVGEDSSMILSPAPYIPPTPKP